MCTGQAAVRVSGSANRRSLMATCHTLISQAHVTIWVQMGGGIIAAADVDDAANMFRF